MRDEHGDVKEVWKTLKNCFLEKAVDVCGDTRDIAIKIEIWLWNEEVAALVKEKQRNICLLWKAPKTCKKRYGCRKTRAKVVRAWKKS